MGKYILALLTAVTSFSAAGSFDFEDLGLEINESGFMNRRTQQIDRSKIIKFDDDRLKAKSKTGSTQVYESLPDSSKVVKAVVRITGTEDRPVFESLNIRHGRTASKGKIRALSADGAIVCEFDKRDTSVKENYCVQVDRKQCENIKNLNKSITKKDFEKCNEFAQAMTATTKYEKEMKKLRDDLKTDFTDVPTYKGSLDFYLEDLQVACREFFGANEVESPKARLNPIPFQDEADTAR